MTAAAFILGLLGLIIATMSLTWQLVTWVLGGRRAIAALVAGYSVPGGAVTGPVTKAGTTTLFSNASAPGTAGAELLGIEVTNKSRAARVLVESVAAVSDLGVRFDPMGSSHGPKLPCWLEAGESQTWLVDAAPARTLVRVARATGQESHWVGMSARLSHGATITTKTRLRVD